MRPTVKKKLIFAAAASSGLLGLIGYPAAKTVYPIKRQTKIVDDYVEIPTATADLTKDIILPEGVGTGTDVPIDISHWLLLSLLKSKHPARRERALNELARHRKWSEAECTEIAQALDRQNIVRLARTMEADLRLFLRPPSVSFIETTLKSNKVEKLVKTILKDVSEQTNSCSSCTSFYTNLSIRVRPNPEVLAMSDLNQVDKMMRIESKKRKKSEHNEDIIRLKAVLNNVICGQSQALVMAQSGMFFALLYFRHKYANDIQINGLLAQILANLSAYGSTRHYLFTDGWIQTLVQYTRDEHLELSLPAFKALANLDEDATKTNGIYGNHVYLLSPLHRDGGNGNFDVVFVHGLVGSVFKSWRQGTIALDEFGERFSPRSFTPTTELIPNSPTGVISEDQNYVNDPNSPEPKRTRCWPKDWLSRDIPNLRILALDYPTALSSWRTDCDLNKDTLRERAKLVLKQLSDAKLGDRPIVWVAHSMGGLLVKQLLVICDEATRQDTNSSCSPNSEELEAYKVFQRNILEQTRGIIFYSVPHKGSNLEWIERKNLQKLLLLTTEVIELQKGSKVLLDLHEKFLDLVNSQNDRIKFLTFAEDAISSFGVNKVVQWRGVLVHEDSLNFGIGPIYKLNIDHAHTCKPNNRDSITYKKTLELIRDLVPATPDQRGEKILPFISFILS